MYRKTHFTETAQTQLDFVVGVSIFLIAFTIVLAGTGPLLEPFTTGQENIATTDRVADKLTNSLLTTDDRQYNLDKECTVAFFDAYGNDNTVTPPSDCRFGEIQSSDTLNDQFGVPSTYFINITLETSTGNIATIDGVQMAAGNIPSTGTITLSQRVVKVDGTRYYAYVRVAR